MTDIAILQSTFIAPDWERIKELPDQEAADAVAGILGALDTAEKQVFAVRGMALLLVEDRGLWRGRADSMGQWIKRVAPNSFSDCYAAMRTMRELLPDVPLDDLREMKRCNVETLKEVSPRVRREPAVIESAKVKPEREFREQIAREHPDEHIAVKSKMDEAIEMCMALEGCSRKQAEDAIAEFYIAENAVAYEEANGVTA